MSQSVNADRARPQTRHSMTILVCLAVILGCCVWPYLGWLRHPSLFDDDFTRVGSLRRSTVVASLVRPFNEHLAPAFELVGWVAWWAAGERATQVATTFLWASYLATAAAAFLLGAVVRVETKSRFAAAVAVVLFCLESVAAETILWYSASSFVWAAAASLGAWYASARAAFATSVRAGWIWVGLAAFLALLSPLFSAIGILAGPLAAVRLLMTRAPDPPIRWVRGVGPLLGTLAFAVLVAANPGHGAVVTASVRQRLDLGAATWAVVRAPGLVLLPALVGFSPKLDRLPDLLASFGTLGLVSAVGFWAWTDPHRRGLIVTGLGWVLGGYTLAYLARAQAGDRWIFEIGRYHLFPLIGAISWCAAIAGQILDRFETFRPLAGWGGVTLLAFLGLLVHGPAMSDLARQSLQFPDQKQLITAADRLEAICRQEQIPLDQAIRIIDPIVPRWFPRPLPFHPLLYLFGTGPASARYDDLEARRRVVAGLNQNERGLIFGGLDDSPYLEPPSSVLESPTPWSRQGETITPAGERLFFRELTVPADHGELSHLGLARISPGANLELWWAGPDGRWTREQSVRHRVTSLNEHMVLNLGRLPHWQTRFARRFRLIRRHQSFAADDSSRLTLIP